MKINPNNYELNMFNVVTDNGNACIQTKRGSFEVKCIVQYDGKRVKRLYNQKEIINKMSGKTYDQIVERNRILGEQIQEWNNKAWEDHNGI